MLPRDVISTGPLVLRPPAASDREAIAECCDDAVTARFLPVLPVPYTLEDAQAYLKNAEAKWDDGGAEFAIVRDGRYAGSIGVRPPDRWGTAELGYVVAPWARGQGVATTAARAVTDWAFDRGVQRMELQAEVENVGSLLAAFRAGFRDEGRRRDAKAIRDGTRTDLITFGRTPRDLVEPFEQFLPFFAGGGLSDGVVTLEPIRPQDAGEFHRMLEDPTVSAYAVGPAQSLEEHQRRMRYTDYWWLSGQRIELAIRDAGSGRFAGHLQLAQVMPALSQGMVGYSLLEAYRGRGFMTRAVSLLVDWVFASTPLHRVVAGTEKGNRASQRVLKRAGFAKEGVHRELFPKEDGTWSDEIGWVRVRPKNT
ncbi:MAG: GNAT family N-acetyltransferase [Nonomuraea sp.]|nr:GNAT family N-acetyltransferase [Nonomuraea sp.]